MDKVNEARDELEAAKRKLALHERSDRRGPKFYATLRELRYQAAAASVRLRLLQSQTNAGASTRRPTTLTRRDMEFTNGKRRGEVEEVMPL